MVELVELDIVVVCIYSQNNKIKIFIWGDHLSDEWEEMVELVELVEMRADHVTEVRRTSHMTRVTHIPRPARSRCDGGAPSQMPRDWHHFQ
jgi:hypothetical protein